MARLAALFCGILIKTLGYYVAVCKRVSMRSCPCLQGLSMISYLTCDAVSRETQELATALNVWNHDAAVLSTISKLFCSSPVPVRSDIGQDVRPTASLTFDSSDESDAPLVIDGEKNLKRQLASFFYLCNIFLRPPPCAGHSSSVFLRLKT